MSSAGSLSELAAEAFIYGFPLVFDLQEVHRIVRQGLGSVPPTPLNRFGHAASLAANVPDEIAFFERLRVWIQAFEPAERDRAYQQRFEPLGVFAAETPYSDPDLAGALRGGLERY